MQLNEMKFQLPFVSFSSKDFKDSPRKTKYWKINYFFNNCSACYTFYCFCGPGSKSVRQGHRSISMEMIPGSVWSFFFFWLQMMYLLAWRCNGKMKSSRKSIRKIVLAENLKRWECESKLSWTKVSKLINNTFIL